MFGNPDLKFLLVGYDFLAHINVTARLNDEVTRKILKLNGTFSESPPAVKHGFVLLF